MSSNSRTLVTLLSIFWLTMPAFSQEVESTAEKTSRTEGLKKISNSSRNWDFDIRIDHKALETNIELAIEEAMRSIEVSLERLAIHIEPIEINFTNLNTTINPIIIDIPRLNIDIEPIDIDLEALEALEDMEFDMDHDTDEWSHEWDSDEEDMDQDVVILQQKDHDKEKHKEKHDKSKDKHKSIKEKHDKSKEDRTKGLKKIN